MPLKMQPTSVIKANLGLENGGPVHRYFTHSCRLHMDKYIPMDEGNLRTQVDEESTYIVYEEPYAYPQYIGYTKGPVKNYTTPGTGPYWDKRMWSAEGNIIIREIQNKFNRGGY